MLKLDFSGVERTKYISKDGSYIFTITDVEIKPSAKGDSQNLILDLEVYEPADCNGQTTKEFINIHPNALWSCRPFFEAVTGEEQNGELDIDPRALIGQKVGAVMIKDGKYFNAETWFHTDK